MPIGQHDALAPPPIDVERVRRGPVRVSGHETRDAGVAECPECHRKEDVEKRLSTFTAMTSRKSAGL